MTSLTKKQFSLTAPKFVSKLGADLGYLVASAEYSKQAIFDYLNSLDLDNQVKAINDYLSAYVGTDDHERKYKQIKQWCSRVVESTGKPRVVINCPEGYSLQWPKGIATVKKQSAAKQISSSQNGSNTAAAKKAAETAAAKIAEAKSKIAAEAAKIEAESTAKKALAAKKAAEVKAKKQAAEAATAKKEVERLKAEQTAPTNSVQVLFKQYKGLSAKSKGELFALICEYEGIDNPLATKPQIKKAV